MGQFKSVTLYPGQINGIRNRETDEIESVTLNPGQIRLRKRGMSRFIPVTFISSPDHWYKEKRNRSIQFCYLYYVWIALQNKGLFPHENASQRCGGLFSQLPALHAGALLCLRGHNQ